ncbi:S-adenosylmethionine mitochondrial carrier protein [Plakobranchus ocellatus]|uniref:S-adenosylmethionine mitochondrial carrier protein n=1 Tax=Plakobranchus ocellatus TaxID=259542 RepID=A0AAV4DAM5_9GAST|nr:S-adenosylmethionine mitochondrial carrier protein [Plakobranchus ocellatus]
MDDLKCSAAVGQNHKGYFKDILVAGGVAGTAVDAMLFPLDTIKTRLQSEVGLKSSGGFKGLYAGLLSVLLGSAPSAALFFLAYETSKTILGSDGNGSYLYQTSSHMVAASVGDVTSCLIRVPMEIVKQRTQVLKAASSHSTFLMTYQEQGLRGFYKGYFSTIAREIPFSVIQFPLWEFLKHKCSERSGEPSTPGQSSLCAGVAGGISAALTTPLDVVKTRVMLAQTGTKEAYGTIVFVLQSLLRDEGMAGLFAGLVPRLWLMSLGGAIFLGAYDKTKLILSSYTI